MNYIEQFNAFTVKSAGLLSPGAVSLYVRLFQVNNQHHWAEWFPISLSLLQALTKTGSKNTIKTWQEELELHGFVECKRGGHKKPNLFRLPILYGSNTDTKTDTKGDTKTDTKGDTKTDPIIKVNINKKEKEKKSTTYSKKKRAAFSPPTLAEVRAYVSEKGLNVDPQKFFDYFEAGNWHDSMGKPVKSWKQKCLTWDKHDNGRQVKAQPKDIVDSDIDWSRYDG